MKYLAIALDVVVHGGQMRMSKLFNLTGELLIESKLLTQPLYDGVSATLFMSGEINDRPAAFTDLFDDDVVTNMLTRFHRESPFRLDVARPLEIRNRGPTELTSPNARPNVASACRTNLMINEAQAIDSIL
jgi:hypothetical protein